MFFFNFLEFLLHKSQRVNIIEIRKKFSTILKIYKYMFRLKKTK
jgi:hypothetical protein